MVYQIVFRKGVLIINEEELSYKKKFYEKIKENIITGKLCEGERLNERKLSNELGISRTPIREALQLLQKDGWVIIETYKGATVRNFDKKYVKDVLRLREVLEVLNIEDAISNVEREDISELDKIIEQQVDCMINYDPKEFMNYDIIFHRKLYSLSKNEPCTKILNNISDIVRFLGIKVLKLPDRNKNAILEHKNIFNAIKDNNKELAKIYMQIHMKETAKKLLESNIFE